MVFGYFIVLGYLSLLALPPTALFQSLCMVEVTFKNAVYFVILILSKRVMAIHGLVVLPILFIHNL